jgi:hypothetical protein
MGAWLRVLDRHCPLLGIVLLIFTVLFVLFAETSFGPAGALPVQLLGASFQHAKAECVDKVPQCEPWAASGECMRNKAWMSNNCAVACKVCNPSAEAAEDACVDADVQHCPTWASNGECEANKGWMRGHCRLSCHACDAKLPQHAAPPATSDGGGHILHIDVEGPAEDNDEQQRRGQGSTTTPSHQDKEVSFSLPARTHLRGCSRVSAAILLEWRLLIAQRDVDPSSAMAQYQQSKHKYATKWHVDGRTGPYALRGEAGREEPGLLPLPDGWGDSG